METRTRLPKRGKRTGLLGETRRLLRGEEEVAR
jgi:hypothetical protein